jgi:hypothetical protein
MELRGGDIAGDCASGQLAPADLELELGLELRRELE